MIGIIDYGMGNLASVKKAFAYIGAEAVITDDKTVLKSCDGLALPGVGAFADAMENLNQKGLASLIKEAQNTPLLGICLGMQLLFESSEESPGVPGLGILQGTVKRFSASMGLKIPQMGWNKLFIKEDKRLYRNIQQECDVYFIHSYYVDAADRKAVAAECEYGITYDASIETGSLFATQFHPEKSGIVGLQILRNFYAEVTK